MPDYDLGTARGTIELDASSLGRAAAAFASLGAALLGFGAVAVGGFALVVREAAEFEHTLSAVEAVSGATADEMDRLRQTALDLGSSTLYSANQIGGAMEQLAKAGITVEEMLGGATEATITLAAAAGDELSGGVSRAAEVIANAMRTFGAGAEDMDHFADVLVGAAASSTLSVDDIATSMTYAGPIAATLGLTIDDLSTALAILGDRGIRGSTAGTSLRGVLLSLTGASGPAREAMTELGLITADGANAFFDLNGNMKPLPEIMQILGDATRNLSEEEKAAAFNAIFQRRAMNAAMILAEQGAAGFDAYAAAIAGIDAGDVAATKLDNLQGDMTLLKNNVNALVVEVGLHFQDMLRGWVQALDGVVDRLRQLDPALLANILRIVAIAGVVATLLGAFSLMISISIRMYRNFKLLAEGIRLVMGAFRLLSISLLTNPWFLLIAAIVLLGVILYNAYKNVEEFRAIVDRAFAAIRDFVVPIIEEIVGAFHAMVAAFNGEGITSDGLAGFFERIGIAARAVFDFITTELVPGIQGFFRAISSGETSGSGGFLGFMERMGVVARSVIEWLRDVGIPAVIRFAQAVGQVLSEGLRIAGNVIQWFADEVLPRIGWVASEVSERAVSAFNWFKDNVFPIVSAFAELIAAVVQRVVGTFNLLRDIVRETEGVWRPVLQNLLMVVQSVMNSIMAVIRSILGAIVILWQNFGDNIFAAVRMVWDFIIGAIEAALRIIQGIIQVVTGAISGDWSKVWEGIQNIFGGVWDALGNIVNTGLQFIFLVIESAWDGIISFLEIAWNTIKNVFTAALQNIARFLGTSIDGIVQFFRELPGRIVNALISLGTLLLQHGRDLIGGLSRGILEIWTGVVSFFNRLPLTIINTIGNLARLLYHKGREIIQGLIDGVMSMIGAVGNAIGSVVDRVSDFIPGSPVKEGPLTVLNRGYAGKEIVRMIVQGMSQQIPALQSLLRNLTKPIPTQALTTAATAAGGGGAPVNIELVFNGPYGPDFPDQLRQTLSDPTVLDRLVSAVKAGTGRVS